MKLCIKEIFENWVEDESTTIVFSREALLKLTIKYPVFKMGTRDYKGEVKLLVIWVLGNS